MSLTTLRSVLTGSGVRPNPRVDLWRISEPSWWKRLRGHPSAEATKRLILRAIWRLALPVHFVGEEPEDATLAGCLRGEDDGWRIRPDSDPDRFYDSYPVSVLGNWRLYAARDRVDVPWPDPFRADPRTTHEFMREQHVTVLVDSFYDDIEWCVALCETA